MRGIRMHLQSSHPRKTIHHLRTSREALAPVNREPCVIHSSLMSVILTSHRWAAGTALLENYCVQDKSQLPSIFRLTLGMYKNPKDWLEISSSTQYSQVSMAWLTIMIFYLTSLKKKTYLIKFKLEMSYFLFTVSGTSTSTCWQRSSSVNNKIIWKNAVFTFCSSGEVY